MKIERIESIEKKFRHEWLLIQVTQIDETTTTPLKGRLLAHSPHRDEIYDKLLRRKRVQNLYVTCAAGPLPKGRAFAF